MINRDDGFLCGDAKVLSKKTDHIFLAGREKLHLVLDFDRTLTRGKDETGRDVTTWHVLQRHLPDAAKAEYWRLYGKYRPLEARNLITVPDAVAWWSGVLNIYRDNKLKWPDVAKDLMVAMPPRNGVKELFDVCAAKKIPIVIISAGIKNSIELWCQNLGINPEAVLSTNLLFDSQGIVCGWEKKSLIHALNKKEMGQASLSEISGKRPNSILVSDSIHDAGMVGNGSGSLRIIVDDARSDDFSRGDDFFTGIFKKFDLIVRTGDLFPVVKIMEKF